MVLQEFKRKQKTTLKYYMKINGKLHKEVKEKKMKVMQCLQYEWDRKQNG